MTRAADLERAAAVLSAGGVVVYPTETVYGLGADAGSTTALARLLELKGRDAAKGIAVLVATIDEAAALVAAEIPQGARTLATAFWPGPLTIVVPASPAVAPAIVGVSGGVGLRCTSDPVAGALLARFGRPLTSTSANPSGRRAAVTVGEARAYFGARVDAYVDGGSRADRAPSSVVEFLGERAYLRRAGAIDLAALRSVVDVANVRPEGD